MNPSTMSRSSRNVKLSQNPFFVDCTIRYASKDYIEARLIPYERGSALAKGPGREGGQGTPTALRLRLVDPQEDEERKAE